jgi:hypothetical protein
MHETFCSNTDNHQRGRGFDAKNVKVVEKIDQLMSFRCLYGMINIEYNLFSLPFLNLLNPNNIVIIP